MQQTIMVVDDEDWFLQEMEVVVAEIGYQGQVVSDPSQVVTEAAKHQPHLILLDLLLSGTDGREVVRQLQANPQTRQIPVVLMSADMNLKKKAGEVAAAAFIKKPFDLDELEKLIAQVLK